MEFPLIKILWNSQKVVISVKFMALKERGSYSIVLLRTNILNGMRMQMSW